MEELVFELGFPHLKKSHLVFYGIRAVRFERMFQHIYNKFSLVDPRFYPNIVVVHCGTNDIDQPQMTDVVSNSILDELKRIEFLKQMEPTMKLVWSDILLRVWYRSKLHDHALVMTDMINAMAHSFAARTENITVRHHSIDLRKIPYFRHSEHVSDPVHLSNLGIRQWFMEFDLLAKIQFGL